MYVCYFRLETLRCSDMTEGARNHTKWACFLDTSAAALREKAEEEWNQVFPHQPWNINDPFQINRLRQIEQVACNGKLSKKSEEHLNTIQTQGAEFQNWDMTTLTYFLNNTRCLDLRNRNPQLYQAVDKLRALRNQFAHMTTPFGITSCKLRTVYHEFDNCIVVLGVSVTFYQRKLKTLYEEPYTTQGQWPWKKIAIFEAVALFQCVSFHN